MPSLKFSVPHDLELTEAKERIEVLMSKVKHKFGDQFKDLNEEWTDDVLAFAFSSYGMNFKGNLEVSADQVNLAGVIPFTAMMFMGRIEKEVTEALQKTLV